MAADTLPTLIKLAAQRFGAEAARLSPYDDIF